MDIPAFNRHHEPFRGDRFGMPRLTRRERDVVGAVARGLTNKEIAAELGLCEQTVKNAVSAVFAKVGVKSRVQLAIFVAEREFRGSLAGSTQGPAAGPGS